MWLLVWVWVQYTVRDWTEFWVPLARTFKRQNNSYFEEDLYDQSGGPCSLKLAYTPCTSRTTCPQKNWELTFELKKYICITATLINLHWLPVKSHITYKILFLTHKSFSALGPQSDLLHSYTQSWMLQSSAMDLLSFPCSNLHTFGDRAFSVAPTLWNSLPSKLCSAPSTDLFQKLLKTHLFPVVCLYSFIKHSGLPWTALYKSKLYYYYKKWKGKKKETGCIPHLPKLFGFLEGFQASLKH